MTTIAVVNQKGGVGKTTIAFNLAKMLTAKRTTKVLAIDNDPQGNLTSSLLPESGRLAANIFSAYDSSAQTQFPQKVADNLDLIGADISLAKVVEGDFEVIFRLNDTIEQLQAMPDAADFVIIDCLPSFGQLHLASLVAADYVLVPVKLAPYAMAGLKDLFSTVEKVQRRLNPHLKVLGIVPNLVDGRKPVMEREMEEALREAYGDMVFKTKLNKRVRVEESPAFQQDVVEYDPKGASAGEFKAFVRELLARLKKEEARQ